MKKLIFLSSVMIVFALGCSTIKGIGEDIKGLGNGIANASVKVKDSMSKNNDQ